MRKAFSMIELVFVIVVIGILATIAIPRFSATRDDATLTKAKSIVSNVRTALNSEVQARILKGDYTAISDLGGETNGYNTDIFDYFDSNSSGTRVLEYPIKSCQSSTATGCWMRIGNTSYQYIFPSAIGGSVTFAVSGGRFICDGTSKCDYLER